MLYGRNVVVCALSGPRIHRQVLISDTVRPDDRLAESIRLAGILELSVRQVSRDDLDALLPGVRHGGIALETSPFLYAEFRDVLSSSGPLLALDHMQDPQNVGAILRTAEALGVSGAILPRDRSSGITPAVASASAGASEMIPVCQVTNLGTTIDTLKDAGWWIIGLDNSPNAVPIHETPDLAPALLVVGSEQQGLSPSVRQRCDVVARIEMAGKMESLNASVAAAIGLYELTVASR